MYVVGESRKDPTRPTRHPPFYFQALSIPIVVERRRTPPILVVKLRSSITYLIDADDDDDEMMMMMMTTISVPERFRLAPNTCPSDARLSFSFLLAISCYC
jgi:hypothetical protein